MPKTWKVGVRFDDTTGAKAPWEAINRVYENGKLVNTVRWGSFKTEDAAMKKTAKRVENCKADPIFAHDGKTIEFIGRIEK